ncbi:ras guanine nucleotide exchange factor domain-containing protein [Crepidotus variabilis]|uniref:Ras guanine nucleotide exchange factor domain-containing protein n=1 Tax=Crepidotus variabilis TaxID=179855 RepID=A0A9P6EN30_9AGAR|nr:ras guanine nucleotide exchange factor domain-containing protein [Crepidotus variabilis]
MPTFHSRSQAGRPPLYLSTQVSPPSKPNFPSTQLDAGRNQGSISDTQDSIVFSVLCLYEFDSDEAGLLSFRKGEMLDIIKRDETGWWAAMRQDGLGPADVGWIPQAFVRALSEEMAEKLRPINEACRQAEYEAELLYNTPPGGAYLSIFETDSPAQSPALSDDAARIFSKGTSYSHSSTALAQNYPEMRQVKGKQDENVNPYSPVAFPSMRPNPPPSPTSPVPRPPSRSSSFKRSWKNTPPTSDSESKPSRVGSLRPSRSFRVQPMQQSEGGLSWLTNRSDSLKSREPSKSSSPGLAGSFESFYKRLGDDKAQRRKASEDSSLHHTSRSSHASKPSYLQPAQSLALDEDEKGNIRSGTLPALIDRLTTETPHNETPHNQTKNRTFINVFLMTFRTFTTSHELFDNLIDRFYCKPPKSVPEHAIREWKKVTRLPVRKRVLELFTIWLENHRLLDEEPEVAQHLQHFLARIQDPHFIAMAKELLQTLERLTFTIPNESPVIACKKPRKSKSLKTDLLKFDVPDIAEQLTIFEFSLYSKITPRECLEYVKTQSGPSVVGLQAFCSIHDKLGSFVKTSTLNQETLSKRAEAVDFWIKVAEKCRAMSNFSSMSAIISALSSTAITQLHMTWAHVGRKSALDALLRHNEPMGGFAGYRNLLQQTEGPCVPFITMYLTDMVRAKEQFPSEEGVIFFQQRARWYDIISNMLKFQSKVYKIALDENTVSLIEAQLREGFRDQNWIWDRSQVVHHSEIKQADIRRGLEAAGF